MHLESVTRWQWMLLGLVLGLGLGYSRSYRANDLTAYGEGINDQRVFERRVLSNVGGSPLFKNIRVSRQVLDDGAGNVETVYIVSGKSVPENALAGERYKDMWYAAHVPYRPAIDLGQIAQTKKPQALARWQGVVHPTVLDWLALAHETAGVSYSNAWWDTYAVRTFTIGGFLVVGVIWPFFVNLYYFRSLFRPRGEKAVSLGGVHAPAPAAAIPSMEVDLGHLCELEQELEAGMGVSGPVAVSGEAKSGVAVLAADATPVAPEEAHDDRHFRAKPDDYYPTEERVHPPE
jgi:hypothetical protein